MITITLNNILPSTVPSNGWKVGYKVKGSLDPYVVLPVNYFSQPIIFSVNYPDGTLFEGYVQADCGDGNLTPPFLWETACNCPSGYTIGSDGLFCEKEETTAPTLLIADSCLISSTNTTHSVSGSRIYTAPFQSSALGLSVGAVHPDIQATMVSTYWSNLALNTTNGPLNRSAVWLDSDCNDSKDSLPVGQHLTVGYTYNSAESKTIYVGVAANVDFKLKVNGVTIADTTTISPVMGNKKDRVWHIIPVQIEIGNNYFDLIGTSSGSIADAVGMIIYNNTFSQLQAATSDVDLNILFNSASLRGTAYNIMTCTDGWNLDTSGEEGFVCKKVLRTTCNTPTVGDCESPSIIGTHSITQTTIGVTWSTSPTAIGGYIVEYRPAFTTLWTQMPPTMATSAIISGLSQNTSYDIRVVSVCGDGQFSASGLAILTTLANPPCSSSATSRTVIRTVPVNEIWEMGCDGGTVVIPYSVLSLGDNELLDIEVLYNNSVIGSALNLVNGNSGSIVVNYAPVPPVCFLKLRFTVKLAVPDAPFGISVNSDGGGTSQITNVTSGGLYFYLIDEGSFPCNNNETMEGDSGNFSGNVTVSYVSGNAGDYLRIYKNGSVIASQLVELTSGNVTFTGLSWTTSDNILIILEND